MILLSAVVLVAVLIFTWCRRSRLYTVAVLPRLGTRVVVPCSINDSGQVVGLCQGRFYLWERGKDWRELGRASGGLDINNAGQIAGTIDDPNGGKQAFLWDPADGSRLLGTLGGVGSEARAINHLGQVVGWSEASPGVAHAFIWAKTGGMQDLGVGFASGVNDTGQVIVYGNAGLLLVDAGRGGVAATEIPPINNPYFSGTYCINNNGYVFGEGLNSNKGRTYTFIWRQDRGIEWLSPRGDRAIFTVAFNDANQVAVCERVWYSDWLKRLTKRNLRPYRQSFLWTRQRGRVFLDKYVRDQSGDYFSIAGLNNNGCIVGTVNRDSGSIFRAVLLDPIPERWGK